MKLIYTIITTLCFSTLLLMSCKSDKSAPLETKSPNQSNYCDTANVSFSNDLQPLFLTHCAYSGCHNTGTAASNIILDNHAGVSTISNQAARLVGAIKGETGYSKMPPSGAGFTSLEIEKLECWINKGSLNN